MRGWPVVWALAVVFSVAPAFADYRHRVVVVEPASDDGASEVRARLRGELRAAGFDVIALPAPSSGEPREVSDTTARDLHPAAVLLVASTPNTGGPGTGEIWLSDRLLRRTFVLKFSLNTSEPSRDAARVAVQAVEILKADLAELALTREEEPPPPPEPPPPAPPIPEIEPAPPAREPAGFEPRVEAGIGVLQGFSGLSAALTPVVRLGLRLPEAWLGEGAPALDVMLSCAAFGGELRKQRPAGEARVKQTLGTFAIATRFAPEHVAQPFLFVSSGVYGVRVDGLDTRGVSRSADTWSAVSGGGGGLFVQPTKGIALVMSGELLAAWSRTLVNIAEQRVASAGAPVLLLSAGVAGVF